MLTDKKIVLVFWMAFLLLGITGYMGEKALADSRQGEPTLSVSQVLRKVKVPSLTPIPNEAELIFRSQRGGRRSPDGQYNYELWASDAEGKHLTQITHNGYFYAHFDVSPNRRYIAAMRMTRGDTNHNGRIEERDRKTLWILDLEAKEEWPLLEEYDSGLGGVVWSPDGKYIYLSVMFGSGTDICRVRPDGSGLENITKNLYKSPGFSRFKWVSDVGISRDGQWLAFLYQTTKAGPSVIAVCYTDGTQARMVTDGGGLNSKHAGGEWGRGDFDPEFSLDGRHICFQRATDMALSSFNVSSHDIMAINIEDGRLTRLSPAGNRAVHGVCHWSEDNRIVFSEWNETDRFAGPVVVNPDGSNYHRIQGTSGGAWVRWLWKVK
jgi:Tol biopolymer transport system component